MASNKDAIDFMKSLWDNENGSKMTEPPDRLTSNADVVELADTLDLGSSARACRFKSCHPHQI